MSAPTNYNKISTEKTISDIVVDTVEPSVDPIPEVEETKEPEIQITHSSPIGVVVNCEKLNVRRKPNIKSGVVCVISKGTELEIDEAGSATDFYKVRSTSDTEGFYGFCMKKYISVEK